MVSEMLNYLKSSVAVAVLAGGILMTPAQAQTAAEMSVRMSQLEDEVRQLIGQVEELTFEVKKLKSQAGGAKSGAIEQAPQPSQNMQNKTLADANQGTEQITDQPLAPPAGEEQVAIAALPDDGSGQIVDLNKAPGPQVLGSLSSSAAKSNDGGFQGKVLVAPSQEDAPSGQDPVLIQPPVVEQGILNGDSIEQVSLAPESPEALYERSNESLLRRQFGDAEAGFRTFIEKYPEHSLAGSAQYWLGETFYAQNDYRQAAQAFLRGYQQYPGSRRAADSLLKLGISLGKLGQKQQACAAFDSVSSEYPKSVEARKRAQAEANRAGCSS